jgi:hypothetical protein
MSWDRTGQSVAGVYLGAYTVSGTVMESRVKYGGHVQHTVRLITPITVFGRVADILLLDEYDLFETDIQLSSTTSC